MTRILNGTGMAITLNAATAPLAVTITSPGNVVVPDLFWTTWTTANWDSPMLVNGMLQGIAA